MKLLEETTKITPKEKLLNQLLSLGVEEGELRRILSNYDVSSNITNSSLMELPDCVKVGNKVHITRDDNWDMTGEILAVWYRNQVYPVEQISEVLATPNGDVSSLTIFDETKPKVYHRIVLKTQDRGILIVPCVNGINVMKVE